MRTGQEKLTQFKTVSEFFDEALKLKENNLVKTIVEAIKEATPWFQDVVNNASWVKDVTEAAEGTVPLLPFFLKYAQLLLREREPEKQGYNACTLAYNRAVEEVFANQRGKLQQIEVRPHDKILSNKNPEDIDMSEFKLKNALSHEFIDYADDVFRQFAKIIGLDNNLTNQLLNSIHQSFLIHLRSLLVNLYTEKEFAAFRNLTFLDNSQIELQKILDRHLFYQSWLFNEKKVFQSEPFALSDIYLNIECGVLKYSEIKKPKKEPFDNLINNQNHNQDSEKPKDPFSEKDSNRVDLLTTVLEYIGDSDFNEPIIIQGIAGSGKSSFTLKLVDELKKLGCRPIRILLKDLNLEDNLEDAIPKALQFGERNFDKSNWKPTFNPKWFSDLVSSKSSEKIELDTPKKTQISPYVFIFDGWDEISTAANEGFRDSIDQLLGEMRKILIKDRDGYPPMRVIVTGRPTVDVTNTKLLTNDTPILTIRPLKPKQLTTYINEFQKARQVQPLFVINLPRQSLVTESQPIVNIINQSIDPEFKKIILETYEEAFKELIADHDQDNVSELKGSLAVLGLPLLAYLTLRLMFEIQSKEDLEKLIKNPTNLYRQLIDKTCEGSGKAVPELEEEKHFQLSGNNLRGLLWKTAQSITDLGKESISREELRSRLFPEPDDEEEQLEEIIEQATSINYDARIFSFREKDWTVSVKLLNSRQRVKLLIGNYQVGLLKGKEPKAATLVKRKNGDYYIHITLDEPTQPETETDKVLGVDLGRTDIATTSEGESWSGKQITDKRNHYALLRAVIQKKSSKGTRSSRRRCRELLKRLSGKEKRFQKHINHGISRQLVNNAVTNKQAISLEDLTGIRERTNKKPRSRKDKRLGNNWAFYQLRQFLTYKCVLAGVKLILVNPAWTSQTCHKCHVIGNRKGKKFTCNNCGNKCDADYNGAQNIKALGAIINRPGGSGLSCKLNAETTYIQLNLFDGLGLLKTPGSA